ncbi:MAG: hypothetical protein KDA25_10110, partial [Phycisphaerales bacterium]|nr:hypothetical protein [Phycisphaerales bacterium]
MDRAQREAARAFANPNVFSTVRLDGRLGPLVDILAAEYQEFLREYSVVATIRSDLRLGASFVRAQLGDDHIVRIGETTEHCDVVVRAGELQVFIVDGSEDDLMSAESYPSLW